MNNIFINKWFTKIIYYFLHGYKQPITYLIIYLPIYIYFSRVEF